MTLVYPIESEMYEELLNPGEAHEGIFCGDQKLQVGHTNYISSYIKVCIIMVQAHHVNFHSTRRRRRAGGRSTTTLLACLC